MKRFRAAYARLLEWLVIVLMTVLAVEVTLGVVFRFIGQALAWYDELASVLLAWLTFYGAALASVKRAHIGCPELVEKLPWPARRWTGIVGQVLVIAFFVLLGAVGIDIMPVLASDTLITLPWMPMNVVQSVIPVSAALIILAEVTHLIDLVTARRPPHRVTSLPLSERAQ